MSAGTMELLPKWSTSASSSSPKVPVARVSTLASSSDTARLGSSLSEVTLEFVPCLETAEASLDIGSWGRGTVPCTRGAFPESRCESGAASVSGSRSCLVGVASVLLVVSESKTHSVLVSIPGDGPTLVLASGIVLASGNFPILTRKMRLRAPGTRRLLSVALLTIVIGIGFGAMLLK